MFYKGLIVDNLDPNNNQRVKVRIISVHPMEGDEDYNLVTDEVLPWARPCAPITAPNASDFGEHDVPDVGEWVWLFFEDEEKQRPVYFGIVITDVDVNGTFAQGSNRVSKDRWGNVIYRDANKVQIVKNNGNTIHMDDDGIIIKTSAGHIINLDDKNEKITVKDVSNNVIETTKDMISCKRETGDGVEIINDQINLISDETVDISVKGIKLIEWLASHTHTSGYPTAPTSPPTQLANLEDILHEGVLYKDGVPYTVDENDEDVVNNRLGEEGVVWPVYSEQISKEDEIALMQETYLKEEGKILSDEDALKLYEEQQKERESDWEEYQSKFDDNDAFDEKYPIIRNNIPPYVTSKLSGVDIRLQNVIKEAALRYDFTVTSGYRSPAYQKTLYDKRLTPCDGYDRKSKHNISPSPAVDISPRPYGNRDVTSRNQLYEVMNEMASRQGVRLRWLGNVTMPNGKKDYCHYELV